MTPQLMEELADAASQTKKAIENVQRPHVANKATLEQQSSTASSMCTSLLECVSLVILLHTTWYNVIFEIWPLVIRL